MPKPDTQPAPGRAMGRSTAALATFTLVVLSGAAAADPVAQAPLSIGGDVPGNLLLVPSVEWPTIDSMANLGDYSTARVYVGYFDSEKCYKYSYSATETQRHFYPVRKATGHVCNGASQEWSGNYLNWAATQTIDPFRKALTGGNRVVDTPTETWLEKARYDGNGANSIFPNRRLPASGNNQALVQGATPAAWNNLTNAIWKLGNKMRFTGTGTLTTTTPTAYNPAVHTTLTASTVYEVSVRVKVCDPAFPEANCRQYSSGWKPEGLVQKYANDIRYSVFGYLNDPSMLRDGGVLRARQKFVGPNMLDPEDGVVSNPRKEWDPTTGVLIANPDSADAAATSSVIGAGYPITQSGVINYINKFGQMTTQDHKSHDPVSELYYTAIRYLKHQGNVPAYSELTGSAQARYNLADGFPVITNWDDPIQYGCQNNAILGIGDVNTHRDKNLPGSTATTDEPAKPSQVSNDNTVNVVTATNKVAQLEGLTISTPFTGRENSAYMVGLAYDSHTKDLRPKPGDFEGKQTVATYWVDVRENQVLEPRARNQYWLAAKYGGFTVPDDFDPYNHSTPLPTEWWRTNSDTLSTGDVRPDNFYVASEADKMVESLNRAFAKIVAETVGSASALASNSTRLDTDTRTFQAQFLAGTWRGDVKAYALNSDGTLSNSPEWTAGGRLASKPWTSRNIYVHNPQGTGAGKYTTFEWSNLGAKQKDALLSEDVVNFLRGDRSKEESQAGGTLRTRTGVLGDIVNSTPIYVGRPNARLHAGAKFNGAASYGAFVQAQQERMDVVYVGANDGMLHAFDAETGDEVYAFVPNAAIMNELADLSNPAYKHRYFVDGDMAIADVYVGGKWKTVLVGTLGRAGAGVFALDVTDPEDVEFLWEKSADELPALGANVGRPVIAQIADGDWRVLLGNGHDNPAGRAQLVMISIEDGEVTEVDTGSGGGNGLSAVLARDSDGDSFADVAYAGDLNGNLWKISDLKDGGKPTVIFEATDPSNPQPITAAPLVGKDPATGITWVFFGTGRYLTEADLKDTQRQTWYGIKDDGGSAKGRDDLIERRIEHVGTAGEFTVRVIEAGTAAEVESSGGWFIDLPASGERMVVPNRFQGAVLIGTTRIPEASDACRRGGSGWIMAINPFTGARLELTFFDVNRDGVFDDDDRLLIDKLRHIVSGILVDSGTQESIFIDDNMLINKDDGTMDSIKTQGAAVAARRMSWRELIN